MTRPRFPGPVSLCIALPCVLAAGAAIAAEPTQAPPQPAPATQAQAQSQSRYVVRDAQTGLLRAPTEEELSAMLAREQSVARTAVAPRATVVRKYPGGMRGAVLGAEHLVTLQAQRRGDGTVDISHTDPALAHPAPATQLPTE